MALTPLGARALLGLPAGELASLDCPVADVLGADGAELTERVRPASDWAGRFAAVEDVLLRRLRAGSGPAPEVAGRVGWSAPRRRCDARLGA